MSAWSCRPTPTADVFAHQPDPATLPRFYQIADQVWERVGPHTACVPLLEAHARFEAWSREAKTHDLEAEKAPLGSDEALAHRRLARLIGRDALMLCSAVLAAEIWERAQGARR